MPKANTAKIAALNDHARQTFRECRVVITQPVAQLGKDDVDHILKEVRNYNDFTPINDPFLEHDFGLIQLAENTIFWKIDYYNLDLQMHAPDPSDETVTARVLTIMLARSIKQLQFKLSMGVLPHQTPAAFDCASGNKHSKTALVKVRTLGCLQVKHSV